MSGRVTFAAIIAWYGWCPGRKLSGTVEEIREGAGEIYYKSLKYDWYDYFAGPGADRRCGGRVKSDAAAPFDWHMSVKEWVKVQVKEACTFLAAERPKEFLRCTFLAAERPKEFL